MINESISFEVIHTNPGTTLGLEIWFDQQCLIDCLNFDSNLKFYHKFTDQPKTHQLKIVIKNKTPAHTVLDANNNIIADSAAKIQDFRLNDILMIDSFFIQAQYQTNAGGTKKLIDCFGYLGFNGQVIFDFDSPVDDWAIANYC